MKTRRRARRLTLEVLYEFDVADHPADAVLSRRLEETQMAQRTANFAEKLVMGVTENLNQLDELISKYAPEWPLDQMAIIDRNILRIAIFEFLIDGNTPMKVAINEAVELAKAYGSDSAPRFVNGVLGSLASEVEVQV